MRIRGISCNDLETEGWGGVGDLHETIFNFIKTQSYGWLERRRKDNKRMRFLTIRGRSKEHSEVRYYTGNLTRHFCLFERCFVRREKEDRVLSLFLTQITAFLRKSTKQRLSDRQL